MPFAFGCRAHGACSFLYLLLPASHSHPNTQEPRALPSQLAKTGQAGSPGGGGPVASGWLNNCAPVA